jgi:F-box interacting protein
MVSCNSDNTVTEVSRYGFLCSPHSSILGVCNGVVCLKRQYDSIINLWNPSIKKLKQLPFDGYEPRFTAFGFAYDSQNNDYKIIRIKSNIDYFSYEGVPLIEAAVYTLSSNSWRKLKQPITGKSHSISYMAGTNPVFFNGALHWIASSNNDNRVVYPFIVAFDVNDEKFRLIMLPPNASIDKDLLDFITYLVDYKGSLALITYLVDYNVITTGVKVIWIMKEYGVLESWTKQIVEDADSLDPMIKYSKNFHLRNDSSIVHTTNTIESTELVILNKKKIC